MGRKDRVVISPETHDPESYIPGESGSHGAQQMPRVSVRELSKSYGVGDDAVTIIKSLSFDVMPGEIVCIVGPSGVGKTTLLKCLTGLQPASSGGAYIDGKRISGPPKEMAPVFQEYTRSLMAWLSVRKNVRLPLRHMRLPKEQLNQRIDQALEAVGLTQAVNKYPWQLSGGMQQRVAIARALAYRPEVLVMDEPFASVDAQTRFELEDLCLRIREQFNMTIMVVTHDIDEGIYLSDRVVVLGQKPAVVSKILPVDLPAPRNQLTTRARSDFATLRSEIFSLIQAGKEPTGTIRLGA